MTSTGALHDPGWVGPLLGIGFFLLGVIATFAFQRLRPRVAGNDPTLLRVAHNLNGFVYRCVNDPAWTIIFMTEGTEELTGYPAGAFLGDEPVHWGDVIHPDDAQVVWATVQDALARREAYEISYRIRTRGGETRWVYERGRGVHDGNGTLGHLEGHVIDDTARRQAEDLLRIRNAALSESEAQYRMLFEGSRDGIAYADVDRLCLVTANPRFAAMLGRPRETVAQLRIQDIHPAAELDHVLERLRALAEGRETVVLDIPLQRHDGTILYADVSGHFLQLEGRWLLAGFFRDARQRRQEVEHAQELHQRLEARVQERTRELDTARIEAERANRAKSEFLARMSHELRTPLNAILGFGQLLESDADYPLGEIQADNLQEIQTAGQHLLSMVNEVLDLSRVESGQMEVRLEALALEPQIRSCMRQVEPLAARRTITLDLAMEPGLEPDPGASAAVFADPVRLREILLNLLSNAVKYNRQGGHIQIRCAASGSGLWRVRIQDTGIGIAEAAMPRLFRPFERLESSNTGIEGTGIGLALAKRLVEAMHGKIGVESVPGEGSTFWFELPMSHLPDPLGEGPRLAAPRSVAPVGRRSAPTEPPNPAEILREFPK